jgi:hypothetical protein
VSLAETQQIYELLVKIDELLANVEVKTQTLERELPVTKDALMTTRQLERVTLRYIALARSMGLPKDATQIINVLMRMVVIMRMLEISGTMLFSGTPYGILLGIAGIAMTQASMLEGY